MIKVITRPIKSAILSTLARFGYELRRKVQFAQGMEVVDAVSHNTKERMDEFFGKDSTVREYLSPTRTEFYDEVISLLSSKLMSINDKIVVDVGCGTGDMLARLCNGRKPSQAIALDFSAAAVERAKQTCPFAECNVYDLYTRPSYRGDVLLCLEVLEHLERPDTAIKNVLGMLNPGGKAVITVPNGREDTFLGHVNFWSPESWRVFVRLNAPNLQAEFLSLQEGRTNCAIIGG